MAYLDCVGQTETSFMVQVKGLDRNHRYERIVEYYLDGRYQGFVRIPPYSDSGGNMTFYVSSYDRYYVRAEITGENIPSPVVLTGTFYPLKPKPAFSSFGAYADNDNQELSVSWQVRNFDSSCYVKIFIYSLSNGWTYDFGPYYTSSNTRIYSFSPGTYRIWGEVYDNNGYQDDSGTYEREIREVIPTLVSFSVQQISETLTATCRFSVRDAKPGTTYSIRASSSSPSSYTSSGYEKESLSYNSTSATIAFDMAKKYWVWINLYYDGVYRETLMDTVTITLTKPGYWAWTAAELAAFGNKGDFTTLTKARWKSFLQHVNTWGVYLRNTKGTSYTPIPDSMMNYSGPMSSVFQEVNNKINAFCQSANKTGTGISNTDLGVGKPVKGSYFTTFADCLNTKIRPNVS